MSVVTATISSAGINMPDIWHLLSVDITREVNRIPYARLVLLDGDPAKQRFEVSNDNFFEPGKEIEIKLRYEGEEGKPGQDQTVFKGLVIRHGVEMNAVGSQLTLELKDAAVKMTRMRRSEVYRDKTDGDIVNGIVGNYEGFIKKGDIGWVGLPTHSEIVQYYCTDWDFIVSRAQANRLLVVVTDGKVSMLPIPVSTEVKHAFEIGKDEIYSLEMEADATHQYKEVESVAWDIRQQKLTEPAKANNYDDLSPGNLKRNDIAGSVGSTTCTLVSPVPLDPGELQAWANATMTISQWSLVRGRIAVPGFADIQLMERMKIAGVGNRFNGETLITGIRHQVDLNGWRTHVQFGLSAEWFCRRPDIVDVPAAGLLPAVNGLQIGVVDKFEKDPDGEFRVKVKLQLPGITQAIWARFASPDAGKGLNDKGRGFFFPPEPGDEVIVGFFNDDPRHAVVLGSLYSSNRQPPDKFSVTVSSGGGTGEADVQEGIVGKQGEVLHFGYKDRASVILRTPRSGGKFSQIWLDDHDEALWLNDCHGNSICMNKSGISVSTNDKKCLMIDTKGNVEFNGDVTIKGKLHQGK